MISGAIAMTAGAALDKGNVRDGRAGYVIGGIFRIGFRGQPLCRFHRCRDGLGSRLRSSFGLQAAKELVDVKTFRLVF